MLTQEWAEPKDAEHRLFKAASDIKDAEGHVLVTVYAVLRPDGQWSLMLINKDYDNSHTVNITFHNEDANDDTFFCRTGREDHLRQGPVHMAFGTERWLSRSRWSSRAFHSTRGNGPLHTAGSVHDCTTRPDRSHVAIELRLLFLRALNIGTMAYDTEFAIAIGRRVISKCRPL